VISNQAGHDRTLSPPRAKATVSSSGVTGRTVQVRDGGRPPPVGTPQGRADDPSRPQPVGGVYASDLPGPPPAQPQPQPRQPQQQVTGSELVSDGHLQPRNDRLAGHGLMTFTTETGYIYLFVLAEQLLRPNVHSHCT